MVLGNRRTGQDSGYVEADRYRLVSQTIATLVVHRSTTPPLHLLHHILVPWCQLGRDGGGTCAASAALAVPISRSIRARCASRACWSRRSCPEARVTASGLLAVTSVATSVWTRWASGDPQAARSATTSCRRKDASDSGAWYWTRSSIGMLLAGSQLSAAWRAILTAVATSWLSPAWMARSAVIESVTPPAHDSMSEFSSCTIPRRSAARWAVDGWCGMAASASPATSTRPPASIHRGVRSAGHPDARAEIRRAPPGPGIVIVPPGSGAILRPPRRDAVGSQTIAEGSPGWRHGPPAGAGVGYKSW